MLCALYCMYCYLNFKASYLYYEIFIYRYIHQTVWSLFYTIILCILGRAIFVIRNCNKVYKGKHELLCTTENKDIGRYMAYVDFPGVKLHPMTAEGAFCLCGNDRCNQNDVKTMLNPNQTSILQDIPEIPIYIPESITDYKDLQDLVTYSTARALEYNQTSDPTTDMETPGLSSLPNVSTNNMETSTGQSSLSSVTYSDPRMVVFLIVTQYYHTLIIDYTNSF